MGMGRKTADGRRALRTGEYQRKSGTFEYKYKDRDGRIISISAPTLDELRQKEEEAKKDLAEGIRGKGRRETLNDWFGVWKAAKTGLKSNTYSNYVYMYDQFVRDTIGRRGIRDIKHHDIKIYYKDLLEHHVTRDGEPIKINTLDVLQNVLHQVFDTALKADIIRRNPTDGALTEFKRAEPKTKRKALTLEEQARFLEVIRGTVWEPVFGLMMETGIRIGEAAGLIWDDIDEAAGVIRIRRTLVYFKDADAGKCMYRVNTTKTAAGHRHIPINDELRRLLALQTDIGHPSTETIDGISGFVFGTRFGDTVNQNTLNRAIKRIVTAANADAEAAVLLPAFSCHTLRHTYTTNAVRAGVDVPALMGLLGHTDSRITLEVYTDIQADMIAEADAKRRAYLEQNRREIPACEDCEENCEEIRTDAQKN